MRLEGKELPIEVRTYRRVEMNISTEFTEVLYKRMENDLDLMQTFKSELVYKYLKKAEKEGFMKYVEVGKLTFKISPKSFYISRSTGESIPVTYQIEVFPAFLNVIQ